MIRRVRACCRLHFGLCRVPVGDAHGPVFGGLGLVVADPAVTVEVVASEAWSATGSLAERALVYGRFLSVQPLRIVAAGPEEHVGFGVGTALGMAVARALHPQADPNALAQLAGRGGRSGIGVAGFERGGFFHDRGKTDGVSNGCERFAFPADWRIVLARPPVSPTWHGAAERAAFARPVAAPPLWDLAAAVAETVRAADYPRFANLLTEFNRRAGAPFADAQGGVYAGPAVAAAVGELQSLGAACVGQTSWGPTVFAIVESAGEAARIASQIANATVTRAAAAADYVL